MREGSTPVIPFQERSRIVSHRRQSFSKEIEELIGRGPAYIYLDACQIVEGIVYPYSLCVVLGHLLRELEGSFFSVLINFEDGFEKKVHDGKKVSCSRKKRIKAILELLGLSCEEGIGKEWLQSSSFDKYAHRNSLRFSRNRDSDVIELFEHFETIYRSILCAWREKFLVSVDRIDKICSMPPRKSICTKFLNNIPTNYRVQKHFFEQIGVEWIYPLYAAGAFKYPPHTISIDADSPISYPKWAASEFLSRMAELNPVKVYEILEELPSTDNQSVHLDIINAALQLQTDKCVEIARKEARWIGNCSELIFQIPNKAILLVKHLVSLSEQTTALEVIHSLLKLRIEGTEFKSCLSNSEYIRILGNPISTPEFRLLGIGFTKILIEQFCIVIKCLPKIEQDYTSIRRPAIENHEQNHKRIIRVWDALLISLRDFSEGLMNESGKEVLALLEKDNGNIFRRLSLHLRRLFPEIDQKGTKKFLFEESFINDEDLYHEYFHLLRDTYPRLTNEDKQAYLHIIENNLCTAKWINCRGHNEAMQPSTEGDFQDIRYWQYSKLLPIEDFLTGNWKTRFEEYEKEFGRRPNEDFMHYSGDTWVGPQAPLTDEDLNGMSVKKIIEYLRNWIPEDKPLSPTPEGLSQTLESVVVDRVDDFFLHLDDFKQIDPVYVRGLLRGFRNVIKNGNTLKWCSILEFCLWIVEQPRKKERRKVNVFGFDSGWSWTRNVIIDLIVDGFKYSECSIPIEYRLFVWDIINVLLDDPNPDDSYRIKLEEESSSYLDAISSVRGAALEAAIRYGLWVKNTLDDSDVEPKIDIEDLPELKKRLAHHLDLRREKSVAVHSIYGNWFPWLALLSEQWTRKFLPKIFPSNPEYSRLFDSAWNAYISYRQIYTQPLNLLNNIYKNVISNTKNFSGVLSRKEEGLAEHIVMAFMRGDLKSTHNTQLLNAFFEVQSDELRGYALRYAASVMRAAASTITPETVCRVKALFESRITMAKSGKDSRVFDHEMEAFEQWLDIPLFDDEWAITQLLNSFRIRTTIQMDYLVIEHMAELSHKYPKIVVQCLKQMVEKNEWGFLGFNNNLEIILSEGLKNSEAFNIAERLVNILAVKGHLEFRNLL